MAQNLSIEVIVARYMREAIIAIESKVCTYCALGKWRVITILVDGRDSTREGFKVSCGVQCNQCQSLDSREWRFNPLDRMEKRVLVNVKKD